MSSPSHFGPLSTRSTSATYHGEREFPASMFVEDFEAFQAEGTNVFEKRAAAEYSVLPRSGEPAYFHFLLDGSGSTYKRVETGDKKRVYEHLLRNLEHLVECGVTLRPHDVIYVWTFNTRVQLLCRAERRSLRAHLPDIRAAYKREFDDTTKYYRQTRLYDAIGAVMATIREEYLRHKEADFFLVAFTGGEDIGSETKTLNSMVDDLNSIGGRLHTVFITANMSPASELYQRLESQQNEIMHVDCEKTEPDDITRAFNTLRGLIKVKLVVIHQRGDEMHLTSVANYGYNTLDAAERMMLTLQSLPRETSMLDGLSQMRGWNSRAHSSHKSSIELTLQPDMPLPIEWMQNKVESSSSSRSSKGIGMSSSSRSSKGIGMSSPSHFGPLSTRSTNATYHGEREFPASMFVEDFKAFQAEGTNVLVDRAAAEYSLAPELLQSVEPAYNFHFLLDGSGSTYKRVETGNKKRVYKHLLRNLEHLVECGDTLRPHDVIYVWTFNTRVQLLCRAERRSLRAHLPDIRAAYKREFDDTTKYYRQTRLYDAIGAVMATIREEYLRHKEADFFLVAFTGGEDIGSETKNLDSMVDDLNSIGGRLHTVFITANMAPTSELYQRLESQQNEIMHVDCEKMEPHDVTRAFNTLRKHIKVMLVDIHLRGGEIHVTSVATFGNINFDAQRRMLTLQSLPRETSMLDGLSQMRGWNSRAHSSHKSSIELTLQPDVPLPIDWMQNKVGKTRSEQVSGEVTLGESSHISANTVREIKNENITQRLPHDREQFEQVEENVEQLERKNVKLQSEQEIAKEQQEQAETVKEELEQKIVEDQREQEIAKDQHGQGIVKYQHEQGFVKDQEEHEENVKDQMEQEITKEQQEQQAEIVKEQQPEQDMQLEQLGKGLVMNRRGCVEEEEGRRPWPGSEHFYNFLVIFNILLEPLSNTVAFLVNQGKFTLGLLAIWLQIRAGTSNQFCHKGRVKSKDLILGRFLGQGCSGIFYETLWSGLHESTGRLARKLFPGVPSDVFASEVAPLVALNDHPNILKTYCWTVDNRSCSLVMEYVRDNLSSVVRKRKGAASNLIGTSSAPFKLLEAMDIVLQIANGIQHLHSNDIAHGDLKPNNILINEAKMLVKLVDFGLVETKKRTTLVSQHTRGSQIVEWSAPELVEDYTDDGIEDDASSVSCDENHPKILLEKTDSYSFALICVYVLGGKTRNANLCPNEQISIPSGCPEALATLISMCWSAEPIDRPDFSVICNILEEIVNELKQQLEETDALGNLQEFIIR